jgi:hypothetical protein
MSDYEEKTIWVYLGLTRQEWYDNLPEGTKCAVKFCKEKCMNKNDYLCFKHRKGFTIWKNAFVIKIIQDNKQLKTKIVAANKILDKLCGQCLEEQCCEGTSCHIMDLQEMLNDKSTVNGKLAKDGKQ